MMLTCICSDTGAMGALGLGVLLAVVVAMHRLASPPAFSIIISLSLLFASLSAGLGILVFIHFALHKWAIGHTCSPCAGVFNGQKQTITNRIAKTSEN